MSIQEEKNSIVETLFASACGYGMAEGNGIQSRFADDGSYMPNKTGGTLKGGKAALQKCIDAIPDEYFSDFMYTLYRVAEKTGEEGFECHY